MILSFKYSTDVLDPPPRKHRSLQDDLLFSRDPHDDHDDKNVEYHDDDFSGKLLLIKLFDTDPLTPLRVGDGDKPKLPLQVGAKLGTLASPHIEQRRNHRDSFDENDPSKGPTIIIYMDSHDDGVIVNFHRNNRATKTETEPFLPWKKNHP